MRSVPRDFSVVAQKRGGLVRGGAELAEKIPALLFVQERAGSSR